MKEKVSHIWEKILKWPALPAFLLFSLAFVAVKFVIKGTNINAAYLTSFINTNTPVICICMGVSVVILTGGIDISLGALISLCNVVAVQMMMHGVNYMLTIAVVLLMAVLAGAFNGAVVSYLRIPPLLTTFATQTIFAGLALWVMKVPGGSIAKELSKFYYGKLFGFLPPTLIFIIVPIIIWKIYKKTPEGTRMYASGCDLEKAFLSGINVNRCKIFAYCFAGFCAGVGAVAYTCYVCAGDPDLGNSLDMKAISAAVIGGVSLSGGYGDITGGIFGCLFFGMLTNMIVSLKVNVFTQNLLEALILLGSVLLAIAVKNRNERKGTDNAS